MKFFRYVGENESSHHKATCFGSSRGRIAIPSMPGLHVTVLDAFIESASARPAVSSLRQGQVG